MTARRYGLIPAAGQGARLGGATPKQYLELRGEPMLAHAVRALLASPALEVAFVVLARDDERWATHDWRAFGERVAPLWCGGATRRDSVLNGLVAMANVVDPDDWVLVHDAARPGLAPRLLERLRDRLGESAVGGLLSLPVSDTVKRAADDGRSVAATVERERLWLAQTPQMFRLGLLLDALSAHAGVTDEAAAVERAGHAPLLVEGARANFKVTTAEDLELMRALLERR